MTKANLVKKQIEDAFAGVEYPGDDRIVSHKCWECDEVIALLKGKHWKTLPIASLAHRGSCLSLLSADAFHFFLPAALNACIDEPADAGIICESLILFLIPPELRRLPEVPEQTQQASEAHRGYYLERLQRLSAPQKDAIRAVLEYRQQFHPQSDPLGQIELALQALRK